MQKKLHGLTEALKGSDPGPDNELLRIRAGKRERNCCFSKERAEHMHGCLVQMF